MPQVTHQPFVHPVNCPLPGGESPTARAMALREARALCDEARWLEQAYRRCTGIGDHAALRADLWMRASALLAEACDLINPPQVGE
jgi:hypothetical protein